MLVLALLVSSLTFHESVASVHTLQWTSEGLANNSIRYMVVDSIAS